LQMRHYVYVWECPQLTHNRHLARRREPMSVDANWLERVNMRESIRSWSLGLFGRGAFRSFFPSARHHHDDRPQGI
jgi:hypothetical protein